MCAFGLGMAVTKEVSKSGLEVKQVAEQSEPAAPVTAIDAVKQALKGNWTRLHSDAPGWVVRYRDKHVYVVDNHGFVRSTYTYELIPGNPTRMIEIKDGQVVLRSVFKIENGILKMCTSPWGSPEFPEFSDDYFEYVRIL
jgi:hypothetical protein